jgi:DNA polymerase-3 subunit delta'
MTQDAQDAFLKTLEEPPAYTIFILLVQNHNSLLSTVVSRCQVFNMRKISTQQIETYLLEHYSNDKEQIRFAAIAANGIIGRAIEILSNRELQDLRQLYVSLISKISNASYAELSANAGEFVESKAEAEGLLNFMLSWYRDILVCKQDCENHVLINSDNADIIESQGEKLDESKLNRIIDVIKRTISYINHNVGTKNSIDSMLLNIMEVYNG